MKPQFFKQAHIELKKPKNMTDNECGSLWLHRTKDGQCISLWRASLWTRLKFLFHGKLCLGILSGATQPPVWLDMSKDLFTPDEEKK